MKKMIDIDKIKPCCKMTAYRQCNNPANKAIWVPNGPCQGAYKAICDDHIQAIKERKGTAH